MTRPSVHEAGQALPGYPWSGRTDLWTANDRQHFHAVPAGDRTRTALCGARIDLRRSPPAPVLLSQCPDCAVQVRR